MKLLTKKSVDTILNAKKGVELFNSFKVDNSRVFPVFENEDERKEFYFVTGGLMADFSEDKLRDMYGDCKFFDPKNLESLFIIANFTSSIPTLTEILSNETLAKNVLVNNYNLNPEAIKVIGEYQVYGVKDLLNGKPQRGE